MDWSGVDYCDVFIRLSFWRHPFTTEHPLTLILTAPIHYRASIDSHSDGTHSLQSIHCWDTFLQIWWRNKLILILNDMRASQLSAISHVCWTIPLRHGVTVYKTSKYDQTEPVFVLQEADWLLPSALLWCVHRAPPQWTSRVWRWPGKSHTQSVRIVNTEGLSLKAKTHRSLISGSQSEPSVPVPISQTHLCHWITASHRR